MADEKRASTPTDLAYRRFMFLIDGWDASCGIRVEERKAESGTFPMRLDSDGEAVGEAGKASSHCCTSRGHIGVHLISFEICAGVRIGEGLYSVVINIFKAGDVERHK